MIDKKVITETFNRIAGKYDSYANVQNRIATHLACVIEYKNPRSILEIGCGTGNFTVTILAQFSAARLVAVDISKEMIDIAGRKVGAPGVVFKVADAEAINFRARFDLIVSNATFQWFADLPRALCRFKAMLSRRGAIYFSTFGPETFYQLRESLRLFDGKKHVVAEHFLDKAAVRKILKDRFAKSSIQEKRVTVTYSSLRELLAYIKYTSGVTNGVKKIWTPQALDRVEKIYKKEFKRISATYQVFLCHAQ